MHTHIVHAHPEPLSYNGALTRAAETQMKKQGGTVTTSDLYGAGFDPVEAGRHYSNRAEPERFVPLAEQRHAWRSDTVPEDIRTEIANLERADLVILQFPLWWHGPPAILKGWMDRVFMNGGLYTSRMRYGAGYFKGRRALVSVTTGAPRAALARKAGGRRFRDHVMARSILDALHGFRGPAAFISYGVQGHGYSYEDRETLEERLSDNLGTGRYTCRGWTTQSDFAFLTGRIGMRMDARLDRRAGIQTRVMARAMRSPTWGGRAASRAPSIRLFSFAEVRLRKRRRRSPW